MTTRLDDLIRALDLVGTGSPCWPVSVNLTFADAACLARILRAGQELRQEANQALCRLDDLGQYGLSAYIDLEQECKDYDAAVGGDE